MQTTTIAYAKLRLSDSNVRKTNGDTGLAALAASIAEHGLLQPLIVSPAKGKKTLFDIHAGGRRWRAIGLLIKRGVLAKDHAVDVRLCENEDAAAREISLAENLIREAMTPTDEARAYKDIIAAGADTEAVARRFGVTVRHVQGRLRLADLAEPIFAALAEGEIRRGNAQIRARLCPCAGEVRMRQRLALVPVEQNDVAGGGLLFAKLQAQTDPLNFASHLTTLQRVPGAAPTELFFRRALDSCERLMLTPSRASISAHRRGMVQLGRSATGSLNSGMATRSAAALFTGAGPGATVAFNASRRILVGELSRQKMLAGIPELAAQVADAGELCEFAADQVIIQQGDHSNDVFLILSGICDVVVNGRRIGKRAAGDHVGEMAAIQPTQARSASIVTEDVVVAVKLPEATLSALGAQFPQIYLSIEKELSRRLLQRNSSIGAYRERVRVFIISSVEALPIARIIETAFEHDSFFVELWTAGCFKAANYTIDDLEAAVDNADFAIAIAHADDFVESRDEMWLAPRDNVIFELGLFMGRLGRARAILMEPRGKDVKLPSDLAGITTIPYRFEKGGQNAALMGPACNKLRDHIVALGPMNG